MADDKIKADEPSIEEILSSIRDIISDEDEAQEEGGADAIQDEDAVLDLTDIADDKDVKDVPEKDGDADDRPDPLAGINLDHPDDDLDFTDTPVDDNETGEQEADTAMGNDDIDALLAAMDGDNKADEAGQEDENEPAIVKPVIEEKPDIREEETTSRETVDDESLLDKAAALATVSSMARLADNIAVSRTKEGVTLEDVVRDLLRPMLKQWLDDNLPDLIERMVERELERLAEKASRK